MSEVKDVIVQGLWKNNSALVQLSVCVLAGGHLDRHQRPRAGFGHHPWC